MADAAKAWLFSPDPKIESIAAAIFNREPLGRRDDLSHLRTILEKLGNPHLKLPPVFHVAGTNGKGSTLAFLQAIFEAGGKKVHKFTSPHTMRFEERMIFENQPVTSDLLGEALDSCGDLLQDGRLSFFDVLTILFMQIASKIPADATLLETGLGGRLDATNVAENPAAVILTRISYDHMHLLGHRLVDIAGEKAGIIKKSCPLVIASQPAPEVMPVFLERAAHHHAPVAKWSVQEKDGGLYYTGEYFNGALPMPSLIGAHQIINAGAAIAALEAAGYTDLLTPDILSKAMQNVSWPGRMQKITEGKLADLWPSGWELWLDGAHNDSGAEVLAAQMKIWGGDMPLHLITAMKQKKNPAGFYAPLMPYLSSLSIVPVQTGVGMMPQNDLAGHLKTMNSKVFLEDSIEVAIRNLVFQFKAPQRIVLAGSLYLVGEALRANQNL